MPVAALLTQQLVHESRLGFARRSFFARTGGLACALVMFAAVMAEKNAHWLQWLGPTIYCLAWPPLAWWLARRTDNPRDVERLNLLTDQFLIGIWMVPMDFNLLPVVLAVVMTGMNTIAGGGLRLLWRGLALQGLGVALGMVTYDWHWLPATSLPVIFAAIPLLVFQPLAVGYVAFTAIHALNKKRYELEQLSQHDGLSGLYNRMHWEKLVRNEFSRYQRGSDAAVLVMVDLDHFKLINDTHGHTAGDEAIRRLAASFNRILRETDVSGRYGGEEFGILLPGTRAEAAGEVVERLRRDLVEHPLLDGQHVTASFGLVELDDEIESVEHWIRLTDTMLYRAKRLGRNRVVDLSQLTDSAWAKLEAQAG